jgi:hypothetical protein
MTKSKQAIPIDAPALFALLGRPLEDAAVQAVVQASGKVKVQKPGRDGQYVFAKEAGYALLLRPVLGASKGTPHTVEEIFLHSEGQDGYRGFALPWAFRAGTLEADVRKAHGPSLSGDGDLWLLDGVYVEATYTEGDVAEIKVNGDYSKSRLLDLRVRRTELPWDRVRRQFDVEQAKKK